MQVRPGTIGITAKIRFREEADFAVVVSAIDERERVVFVRASSALSGDRSAE
jgi:hypothetical protein